MLSVGQGAHVDQRLVDSVLEARAVGGPARTLGRDVEEDVVLAWM